MNHRLTSLAAGRCAGLFTLGLVLLLPIWQVRAQQPAPSPASSADTKAAEKTPELPAKIGLLDTKIRVEANGDWRKEVHTRIHINNEIGVRQFSRLNFDYNRAFQQIEIPSVHITHASGGTADILPSAVADTPNAAVVDAPAYQDVRVKSVRILGLAPGDDLEYSVITLTNHGPLGPNFFLSHDFAAEGLVLTELFEIDQPASRAVKPWTSQGAATFDTEKSSDGDHTIYRWKRVEKKTEEGKDSSNDSSRASASTSSDSTLLVESDVVLSSFANWTELAKVMQESLGVNAAVAPEVRAKAEELTRSAPSIEDKWRALYDFVSQKLPTVDLPLGATGFRLRPPEAILAGGPAIGEEKGGLLYALARSLQLDARLSLAASNTRAQRGPVVPTALTSVLVVARGSTKTFWLDPSVEVAPFGMIASNLRGKPALSLSSASDARLFETVPRSLPFAASQKVTVDASLAADGTLHAKVHYTMRGENELLLRVAFHQSPREKWKEVAQLMSLSDGFRGKILSASASDPYDTRHPFLVDYEISQPKFVDWSKQPVRVPPMMPQVGMPELPAKTSGASKSAPIDLGTPLNVDARLTLHVPPNVSIKGPTGTSVERDYATFTSHYAAEGSVIFASRHINFILREVPATRVADYSAFLHAVQTDQAQLFTLTKPELGNLGNKVAESKP